MRNVITSRQNQTIIKICKLAEKKNRESEQLFRFDGIKLYREAVSVNIEFKYILMRESDYDSIIDRIISSGTKSPEDIGADILILSDNVFDAVSEEKSPEGIICVAKYIDKFHKIATIDINLFQDRSIMPKIDEKIIILEDIRDPGNFGTILRSAAALGINFVILIGDCADIYNPKTLRAAMGAIFKIKTINCRNGIAIIEKLKESGRRILAATLDIEAETLGTKSLKSTDCIVIGNEGHGISPTIAAVCNKKIEIPMSKGNESLNASAAAAIFIWELVKSKQ